MIRFLQLLKLKNIWAGWRSSLTAMAVLGLCVWLVVSGRATLTEALEASPIILTLLLAPDEILKRAQGPLFLILGLLWLTACQSHKPVSESKMQVEKTTRTRTIEVPLPGDSSGLVIGPEDLQPTATELSKTWDLPGVAGPGQILPNAQPGEVFAPQNPARLVWRKQSRGTRSRTTASLYSDGRVHIQSHCDSLELAVTAQDSIIKTLSQTRTTVTEKRPVWPWFLAGLGAGIILTTVWRLIKIPLA